MKLSGKNVVVTGAASGIGKALTMQLAEMGAHVFALDYDAKRLAVLNKEVQQHGWKLTTHVSDVSDYEAMATFTDKHFSSKPLDVFINNAGVAIVASLAASEPADYERILNVNLKGVINGTKVALSKMEARGKGTIANIASTAGHVPAPFLSIYTASKFGVVGFTRAIQEELRQKSSPVKLSLISPGFVRTEMTEKQAFPDWLSFMLSTPEKTAKEILTAIRQEKSEAHPGLGGKIMKAMHNVAPRSTVKGSKVLLAKSFKDLLLRRFEQPD